MASIETFFDKPSGTIPMETSSSQEKKIIWNIECIECKRITKMTITNEKNINYHRVGEIIKGPTCKRCKKIAREKNEKINGSNYKLLELF